MIFKSYLFKERIPLVNKAMDTYAMRQSTIAKNIANATTPGYQPEKVRFEEFFNESQVAASGLKSSERHISLGRKAENEIYPENSKAEIPEPETYFSGESHVNIDKEMSELAKNQIKFRFASRAMRAYLNVMQSAIRGSMR